MVAVCISIAATYLFVASPKYRVDANCGCCCLLCLFCLGVCLVSFVCVCVLVSLLDLGLLICMSCVETDNRCDLNITAVYAAHGSSTEKGHVQRS